MIVRLVAPIAGRPRIRVRLRPTFGYGWGVPEKTRGSNHIRYLLPTMTLRLTTNGKKGSDEGPTTEKKRREEGSEDTRVSEGKLGRVLTPSLSLLFSLFLT
jgi:hypothetical protein